MTSTIAIERPPVPLPPAPNRRKSAPVKEELKTGVKPTAVAFGLSFVLHIIFLAGLSMIPASRILHSNRPRLIEVTYVDRPPEPAAPAEKTASPEKKTNVPDMASLVASKMNLPKREASLSDVAKKLTSSQNSAPSRAPVLSDKSGAPDLTRFASVPGTSRQASPALQDAGAGSLAGFTKIPSLARTSQPVLTEKSGGPAVPLSAPMGAGTGRSASAAPALKENAQAFSPALSNGGSWSGTPVSARSEASVGVAAVGISGSDSGPVGIGIEGEIATRKILKSRTPPYPEWAQRKGIQAVVSLRLTVLADGRVKQDIILERTSGYKALDEIAIQTLRDWLFEPLPKTAWREQWGVVNFVFKLDS